MTEERFEDARDRALSRVSAEAGEPLRAWGAKHRVHGDDPAWDVLGAITAAGEQASRDAVERVAEAHQQAAEAAGPAIAQAASRYLRWRVGLMLWVGAGLVQAGLLLGAAWLGAELDLTLSRDTSQELEAQIERERRTLAWLRSENNHLRLIQYESEPQTQYLVLPEYPRHRCDGRPCLRIGEADAAQSDANQ